MAEDSEKTDYVVVGVVGVAAVVAIVAMYAFTFPATGSFSVDASVAGRVTEAPSVPVVRTVRVVSVNPYDYSGDGRVTVDDSKLLSEYVVRGSCASGYDCDLNDDGVIDLTDLGVFNARLVASQKPAAVVTGGVVATSKRVSREQSLPVLSALG